MKILLASQSPRRKELLTALGYEFNTVKIDCEEIYPESLPVTEIPAYLAELKANAYPDLQQDEILITADTIVVQDNEVLGKPKGEEEAAEMLKKLSGKTHQVITAVRISSTEKYFIQTDIAEVEMEDISDEEIDLYIRNFKPLDKAGAYGIQEWMGMAKIKNINGSFYTIMGLPTHIVYKGLLDFKL
ncbi:Maf family nucleotide pyrophosphatase [Elizabethkingia meningoseptica]|uniref:Maf family nucleotide pyrophosphatase n=1 Tax=Elizabethkingia meningoseptica TaxID=238 RepID=UPI0009375C03|nr:Maf family nucleotide pyrophosphatase [Elizabethkingia meningoseptica]MDE5490328.1 Maf family nucleotide pyrophosphatase [Elizabethkingia meningoseptica]MVW92207.1 septum formation protein Maf [Elizabethkingia meningoseptica]